MRKLSRKILAVVLACTFSVSAAVCVAAEDIEIPDPIAVYDMEDASQFTVVSNGVETPGIVEDKEDGKGMGNVLRVPSSNGREDSKIAFANPFAGKDLSEGTQTADVRGENYLADDEGMPIWYDGVIINYWIKTVDDTNSVIMHFYNNDRLQYHKDDWRKHVLAVEAKEAYDAAAASGEPIDPRFALGNTATYYDMDGKEYTVYEGGGEYMAYNPDYEVAYVLDGSGTVTAYKDGDDPELEDSWVTIGAAGRDEYAAFYNLDFENNPECLVRQGYTDGFLQFSLDGSISFYEDDGRGVNINPNLVGAKGDFNIRNSLDMFGSTTLTTALSAEDENSMKWHMVTIVIQNDWIDYYIDGELYEDLADEFKWFNDLGINLESADKSFNAGFGLRAPFSRGAAGRGDYLNGNRAGLLLTEWLSLDTTEFFIGGVVEDAAGNERVAEFCIDDVAFYDTLLDEDQIYELYTQGLEKIENGGPIVKPEGMCGDVTGDEKVNASDALAILQHAAKIKTISEEYIANADTDLNEKIDATDALNILKFAATIIPELPVQK